jgi:hypothetical protein
MGLIAHGLVGGSDHEILALEWDRPVLQASNVMARHPAEAFCRDVRRYQHDPGRFIASCSGKDRREIGVASIAT